MMRVISSPSMSTIGLATLILAMELSLLEKGEGRRRRGYSDRPDGCKARGARAPLRCTQAADSSLVFACGARTMARRRKMSRQSFQAFRDTSPAELMWDLLTFDRLLTGPVIHLIYWAGLAILVLLGFSVVGAA